MPGLLILGDDFQGFCLAYSVEDCVYGEISDDGKWSPSEDGMTVIDYATGPTDLDLAVEWRNNAMHAEHAIGRF